MLPGNNTASRNRMSLTTIHPPLSAGPYAAQLQASARMAPGPTTLSDADWSSRLALFSHCGPLHYWYGAQRVDSSSARLLDQIAAHSGAHAYWQAMARGEAVNTIAGQEHSSSARHTALRDPQFGEFAREAARAMQVAETLRSRTHLIWIGTGGSLTGPQALATALCPAERHVDYLSGMDEQAVARAAQHAGADRSLVVVASKSGNTREIAQNHAALRTALGARALALPWVAMTTPGTVLDTDVFQSRLYFDATIGGRFSTLSVMGVFLCAWLQGSGAARDLLAGATACDAAMDHTAWSQNPAWVSALCGLYNRVALGLPARAVIAYSSALAAIPAFVQQLEMESLGKTCRRDGSSLPVVESAPIVMTGEGPQSQHTFFQSLHQNPLACETEILALRSDATGGDLQQERLNNALAQTLALSQGLRAEHPNQCFSGNRPTGLLLLDDASPRTLGALIAHYEHRTVFLGALLGLNPFDQEGVALGKSLADSLRMQLSGASTRLHQLRHTALNDS